VPGANDTASLTTAGTYTITLDVNGMISNLIIGGVAAGVQTLQGNGFTLAATNASVNVGGVVSLTSSTFAGQASIGGGGTFTVNGTTLNARVTVENGGELLLAGASSGIGQGNQPSDANNWLWVQAGGLVSAASSAVLNLYCAMTNAGLVNLTITGCGCRAGVWSARPPARS
jgi:hypothetical protein